MTFIHRPPDSAADPAQARGGSAKPRFGRFVPRWAWAAWANRTSTHYLRKPWLGQTPSTLKSPSASGRRGGTKLFVIQPLTNPPQKNPSKALRMSRVIDLSPRSRSPLSSNSAKADASRVRRKAARKAVSGAGRESGSGAVERATRNRCALAYCRKRFPVDGSADTNHRWPPGGGGR